MTIKLVGADDIAKESDILANYLVLSKFTAVATGNMIEFKVRSGAAGNVKCALYADSSGEPGALITAMNTGQAVSGSGWETLSFTSTLITNGVIYWLAYNTDTNAAIGVRSGTGIRRWKAATYSGFTFPDPAGSGFTSQTDYYDIIAGWGEIFVPFRNYYLHILAH